MGDFVAVVVVAAFSHYFIIISYYYFHRCCSWCCGVVVVVFLTKFYAEKRHKIVPTDRLVLSFFDYVFLYLISWSMARNTVSKCAFWACGVGLDWSSPGPLE